MLYPLDKVGFEYRGTACFEGFIRITFVFSQNLIRSEKPLASITVFQYEHALLCLNHLQCDIAKIRYLWPYTFKLLYEFIKVFSFIVYI
jgi:hypothetical protein